MDKKKKKDLLGKIRIPTAKPTTWFNDKSKYSRKKKHKNSNYVDNIEGITMLYLL